MSERHSKATISGLVLAGGEGRRLGGVDKGLVDHRGRPLVEWVLERLAPQVGPVMIAATASGYERYGFRLLGDAWHEPDGSRAGPLAGLLAGLKSCTTPWLVAVPCDVPGLPNDLVGRLMQAAIEKRADVAVASIAGRAQPVFVLARRETSSTLETYLRSGGRKAEGWYATLSSVAVPFDDEASCFAGANTPDELKTLP
jgi:molybdopterin-guanine dinucleotide biosynthesis protein A